MAGAVRVDLPAARDEPPNLPFADSAADVQVLDREIEDAGPASLAQHRKCRVRDTSVSVVEGHDDWPRRKRPATVPVVPDRAQRHRGVSVARQPAHLAGEVCVRDVELGKRSAGRRVSQHVVHEDRDRCRSGETRGCRLPSGCELRCGRVWRRVPRSVASVEEPWSRSSTARTQSSLRAPRRPGSPRLRDAWRYGCSVRLTWPARSRGAPNRAPTAR